MLSAYSDLETSEAEAQVQIPYEAVKLYKNINAELLYMSKFDSYHYNDPGFGIMIPVHGEGTDNYQPDKWYLFE